MVKCIHKTKKNVCRNQHQNLNKWHGSNNHKHHIDSKIINNTYTLKRLATGKCHGSCNCKYLL